MLPYSYPKPLMILSLSYFYFKFKINFINNRILQIRTEIVQINNSYYIFKLIMTDIFFYQNFTFLRFIDYCSIYNT